jgi:hypothetical protein
MREMPDWSGDGRAQARDSRLTFGGAVRWVSVLARRHSTAQRGVATGRARVRRAPTGSARGIKYAPVRAQRASSSGVSPASGGRRSSSAKIDTAPGSVSSTRDSRRLAPVTATAVAASSGSLSRSFAEPGCVSTRRSKARRVAAGAADRSIASSRSPTDQVWRALVTPRFTGRDARRGLRNATSGIIEVPGPGAPRRSRCKAEFARPLTRV